MCTLNLQGKRPNVLKGNYHCVTIFHGYNYPHALPIHRDIIPMYLRPKRDLYRWIQYYILYVCRIAFVTIIRCKTPFILGNSVLQDCPGNNGLSAPPTHSYSKSIEDLIFRGTNGRIFSNEV